MRDGRLRDAEIFCELDRCSRRLRENTRHRITCCVAERAEHKRGVDRGCRIRRSGFHASTTGSSKETRIENREVQSHDARAILICTPEAPVVECRRHQVNLFYLGIRKEVRTFRCRDNASAIIERNGKLHLCSECRERASRERFLHCFGPSLHWSLERIPCF